LRGRAKLGRAGQLKMDRDRALHSRRIRRRTLWIAFAAVVIGLLGWGVNWLLTDRATVRGGADPGLAASDLAALRAAIHFEDLGPPREKLIAEGRLFVLVAGTRCVVLRYENSWTCQGDHSPVQLRLVDGPRRGEVVWMCADSVYLEPMP
jgi:hypothetical protein